MGVSSVVSLDTTYSTIVDDANSSTTYVGESAIGSSESAPVWRIKKLLTIGTVLKIQWADGNQFFDNTWADRASLTYV